MDSIIAIDVSKTYGVKQILDRVSLTINAGDRVAIIGENGVGKSTLMKLLCGLEQPDSGKLVCDDWVERQYSAQEPFFDNSQNILDLVEKLDRPDECLKIMGLLGFKASNDDILEFRLGSLSGGQRKILDIAHHLASSPAFFFIDEPENHLDIIARDELIKMLEKYWGAVIFVSHDRYFINGVANKIVEIEDGKIRTVSGTYEEYQELRQREIEADARRWEAEKKNIARLEKAVRILQLRARFNTKGSGVYQSRKRELTKRKAVHGNKPSADRDRIKLKSVTVERKSSKQILICEDLSFGYGDIPLFKKVNLRLQFGDRIALIGRNGSGKSSFFKLLKGSSSPNVGVCRLGNNIQVQYFDQIPLLDAKILVLRVVEEELGCHEGVARSFLAKLLFEQGEMALPVAALSGGQKNRLRMALLFAKNPEFIVLDEPTNNLDPTTWEILVEQLQDYQGTLLVVSHDRSFLESIDLDRFWVLHKQTIKEDRRDLSDILKHIR